MAQVQETISIGAPRPAVFALVKDQGLRQRFLPGGWLFQGFLTEMHDDVGATMSIEVSIGPAPTTEVIQLQEVREHDREDQSQLVESPPAADNYITTWTVRDVDGGSLVFLHTDFTYGGLIGEFLVRRRLRKAYRQMLLRLKALAEAASDGRQTYRDGGESL